MSASVIEMQSTQDLEAKALSIPEQATALVITDQSSYERAATFLRDVVAAMRREISDTFDGLVAKAYESHKAATAMRKRHLDPIEAAERIIKQRLGAYELEQRRITEEAERKAKEEADHLAAEIIEAEIEQAEARGASVEEVRAIASTPFALPNPIVPTTFRRVAGITSRKTYTASADFLTVLKSAAMGNQLAASILTIDDKKLNALARAQGPELERLIKGVRVIEETTVATRRK